MEILFCIENLEEYVPKPIYDVIHNYSFLLAPDYYHETIVSTASRIFSEFIDVAALKIIPVETIFSHELSKTRETILENDVLFMNQKTNEYFHVLYNKRTNQLLVNRLIFSYTSPLSLECGNFTFNLLQPLTDPELCAAMGSDSLNVGDDSPASYCQPVLNQPLPKPSFVATPGTTGPYVPPGVSAGFSSAQSTGAPSFDPSPGLSKSGPPLGQPLGDTSGQPSGQSLGDTSGQPSGQSLGDTSGQPSTQPTGPGEPFDPSDKTRFKQFQNFMLTS